jgi:monothiol glutaredoxin
MMRTEINHTVGVNMTESAVFTQIRKALDENDVVLFMKGSKKIPQCGFSAAVVQVLERLGVKDFKDVNVLADNEVREGIKQFNNWPTIPQLFVKGEFIGGCDIVREMYSTGELETLFKEKGVDCAPQAA